MQPMLNIAVRAARRAGDIIIRSVNRVHQLQVHSKDRNDFVTEVDTKAEQDIIETIRRTFPDHAFLCPSALSSSIPRIPATSARRRAP